MFKVTIKTPEWRSTFFVVDFEHISHLFLVLLLLTLNKLVFPGSHPVNLKTLKLVTAATINNVKTRPSKAKVLTWKIFPHHPLYHVLYQKVKKIFLRRKSYWGSWNSLESSVSGSSLWCLVIGSSLSPQWQALHKFFLLKTYVLFYIIFSKTRSHWTYSSICFK